MQHTPSSLQDPEEKIMKQTMKHCELIFVYWDCLLSLNTHTYTHTNTHTHISQCPLWWAGKRGQRSGTLPSVVLPRDSVYPSLQRHFNHTHTQTHTLSHLLCFIEAVASLSLSFEVVPPSHPHRGGQKRRRKEREPRRGSKQWHSSPCFLCHPPVVLYWAHSLLPHLQLTILSFPTPQRLSRVTSLLSYSLHCSLHTHADLSTGQKMGESAAVIIFLQPALFNVCMCSLLCCGMTVWAVNLLSSLTLLMWNVNQTQQAQSFQADASGQRLLSTHPLCPNQYPHPTFRGVPCSHCG